MEWDDLDDTAAEAEEDFRLKTDAWPQPVDARELFLALVAIFHRFLILPNGAAELLALWVIHTYALRYCALRFSPRLMITAPGPNSGKTTLLENLAYLVRFPDPVSIITPAGFFRSLNAGKSVLIDECDHNLPSRAGGKDQLVQMLNAGHKRTTAVKVLTETVRTPTGTQRINRRYSLYSSVAMAGIGAFGPAAVRSRCFKIKLLRKMSHEQVDEFVAEEHAPLMRELRMKIIRFVKDNRDLIRCGRPVLDRELMNNRQRDNAIILLQIADAIGDDCGEQARDAIKKLTSDEVCDPAEMLLGDVAYLLNDPSVLVNYAAKGDPERMLPIGQGGVVFSSDLVNKIAEFFDHREQYQGLTTAKLASWLSQFDICPEDTPKRRGGKDNPTRWYRRDRFDPMFIRYGFVDAETDTPLDDLPNSYANDAQADDPVNPPESATPKQDVLDLEIAGSNVAPFAAPDLETPIAGSDETPQKVGRRMTVEPAAGEKKRAAAMHHALNAWVDAGTISPDDVIFELPLFSVVQRDGQRLWTVVRQETGELDSLPMDSSPIVDSKAEIITVGTINVAESLTTFQFQRLRALVNRYVKHCNS